MRIRSVHPTQWTDEQFVQMTPLARLFAIAIRNEADDQGIFEWKPTSLKMRLFPADNFDIEPLLSELEQHKQVSSYEIDGRKYGIIRNFTKYQRPKKPNSIHPKPPSVPNSAAFKPPTIPQKEEMPAQRKEEGGRRLDEGGSKGVQGESDRADGASPTPTNGHSKRKPKTPFLDTFEPLPTDNDVGLGLGLTEQELEREFSKMADWARAGRILKSDWNATWRNWQREAAERKAVRGKVQGQQFQRH